MPLSRGYVTVIERKLGHTDQDGPMEITICPLVTTRPCESCGAKCKPEGHTNDIEAWRCEACGLLHLITASQVHITKRV